MACDDLVRAAVAKLDDGQKGIRYGSVTLTVHVRGGRIVRTELARAESFEGGTAPSAEHLKGQPEIVDKVFGG